MVKSPSEILIATSNEGKAREITRALSGLPLQIRELKDFPSLHVVGEAGETYEENAVAKAVGYAAQTGLYAVSDDSGLEVDALHGRPGFLSARYGGTGLSEVERNQKLLASMAHINVSRRTARFVCVAVLAEPLQCDETTACVIATSKGICEGTIAATSRGRNGFGYDSIFIPQGHNETFGEMSDPIKNRISHRAQSMLHMRAFLRDLLEQT